MKIVCCGFDVLGEWLSYVMVLLVCEGREGLMCVKSRGGGEWPGQHHGDENSNACATAGAGRP